MVLVTFLRHGRSRADDENVHEGRYDSPLTAAGEEQLRRRAEGWRAEGRTFDHIVSSPLVRARRSAEIIAAAVGGTPEVDDDWAEIDNGGMPGLTFEEADRRYPPKAFETPWDPLGGGECGWDLTARAARALGRVVRGGHERVLVVAHGGVLNHTMRIVVGVPPRAGKTGVSFAFGDAGYAVAEYDPEWHHWYLVELSPGIPVPTSGE
jgi:2,3-bisphosphoglycerate-dependent phosphoglycerate mutase